MTTDARLPLRRILLLDAATCAAMGILLIVAAAPIAGLTALPAGLLFWAGVILIPVAFYMAAVARLAAGNALAVWAVILGNAGWVAASLGLFAFVSPNMLGTGLILAQAAAVGALAWLEAAAWRGKAAMRQAAM